MPRWLGGERVVIRLALAYGVRVVAAVPACGLLLGCALGVAGPVLPAWCVLVALLCCLAVAGVALWTDSSAPLAVAIAVGTIAAGTRLADDAWQRAWRSSLRLAFESVAREERHERTERGEAFPDDDRASVVLVGVLRDDAMVTEGGAVSLRVGAQWMGRAVSQAADPAANPVEGDAAVSVVGRLAVDRMLEWRRGRRVRLTAQLRRPTRYLDPGVADQERASARRGVSLVGTVKSAALVEVVGPAGWLNERAADLRRFSRQAITSAVGRWSPRSAAIVTAIVIGDRAGLDAELQRRLQEAGTYHVIAISGGNIAILAGLTLTAFRLAGLLGRGAMAVAIAGLLAYGSIVSGGASVDRATWMAVVYFAGRALDLRGPPLNALALVAGALVAASPLTIADPAFLLTFGASAGIMFAEQIAPRARSALMRAVLTLGVASLAAEAALFPVSATFFSRVTLAGLALNFIAIPMMAVAQIAGMLVVPLFLVSDLLSAVAGAVAAIGAEALVRSAALVDLAPRLTWRLAAPAFWVIGLYYAAALTWWTLSRRRPAATVGAGPPRHRRLLAASAVVTVAAASWILGEPWTWWAARGDGHLHVTFIDVGQGDAALIRFPRGETMLVDTGGVPSSTFDVGDRIVGQVLRTLGIRRLDTVLVTHGDADHAGGARSIVGEFRPFDVWEGIPVPPSATLQALRRAAERAGSRWRRVQQGDDLFVGETRLSVRHPPPAEWERQHVRNDDSVVVELRWRETSIVLTGDVGGEAERSIAATLSPAGLRILKVGHHGSLTSSSEPFLRALRPDVAVISVGRNNTFGHPAPPVVERLEATGAAIYRTDRDGAIEIETDGMSIDLRTFTGRTRHFVPDDHHHAALNITD